MIERKYDKVKLIIGLLFIKEYNIKEIYPKLEKLFGEIDYKSDIFEFNYTKYYKEEMGWPQYRQYISFKKLINPTKLGKIKHKTNKLELKITNTKKRIINIDPGYISLSKLVLASAKNYSHRIPISNNIYGEITLIYANKKFNNLPWTYPDYGDDKNKKDFDTIRNIYKKNLKEI